MHGSFFVKYHVAAYLHSWLPRDEKRKEKVLHARSYVNLAQTAKQSDSRLGRLRVVVRVPLCQILLAVGRGKVVLAILEFGLIDLAVWLVRACGVRVCTGQVRKANWWINILHRGLKMTDDTKDPPSLCLPFRTTRGCDRCERRLTTAMTTTRVTSSDVHTVTTAGESCY